jgi:SAM-dependent methyltransferase
MGVGPKTEIVGRAYRGAEDTGLDWEGGAKKVIPKSLSCPCCGGGKFSPIVRQLCSVYSSAPYDVAGCHECGHGMTVPVPSPDDLRSVYEHVYFYDVHREIRSEKVYRARLFAEEICRMRPANGPFRVLEIGCMYGALLMELNRRGAIATGIELSEEPARHCRGIGLDVSTESVEQFVARAPDDRFDVVVLSHVLEHLVEPRETISRLLGLLSDGGHIVICVPNFRCLHAKLAGRYWGWWQVPVHVNHFCDSSARRLFGSLGLEVKSTRLRGGDSLTLLLTAMNALGAIHSDRARSMTPFKRFIIGILSKLLRGYYRMGSDELMMTCKYRYHLR